MFYEPVPQRIPAHPKRTIPTAFNQAPFRLPGDVDLIGIRMTYEADEELFGDGESADMLYKVLSGSVRCFTLRYDGRRQIEAFYFPGDIIGLDTRGMHKATAEAISHKTSIVAIWRSSLEDILASDIRTSHQVLGLVSQELQNSRHHALLLGRKHAAERMAGFLLDMMHLQGSAAEVTLPMCRSDIGDYLGLTIETVSRTLTQFERDGVIAMPSSRVLRLLNMDALRGLTA